MIDILSHDLREKIRLVGSPAVNTAQDYSKSIKQATESGRLDDSNQRPDSSVQSTEGPSSKDELCHRPIAYITEVRSNEKGIRKSIHTYFRLEIRVLHLTLADLYLSAN